MKQEYLEATISGIQSKISTAAELNAKSTQIILEASVEVEKLYIALDEPDMRVAEGGKARGKRAKLTTK